MWSPGNRIWERQAKRAAYASAGIPALWEVQWSGRRVELHAQRLDGGVYVLDDQVFLDDGPVTVAASIGKIRIDAQL